MLRWRDDIEGLAQTSPWLALGAGIGKQAARDLASKDSIKALDALVWFIEAAPVFFGRLGLELGPDDVFEMAVKRGE